jgi:hypothetical protein
MNPGSDDPFDAFSQLRLTSSADVVATIQTASQQSRDAPQQISPGWCRPLQNSLRGMDRIIDYPARDMTITVESGASVALVRQTLAAENQQLPIDAASDAITIGELVSYDVHGPRCHGYGTLRDYVIGLEAVDGKGRLFRSGGRVVKNVAGYDLCRLLTGAHGQFAVLTQVTLKLKPMPQCERLAVCNVGSWENLQQALTRLNLSAARPTVMDLWNPSAVRLFLDATPFQEQAGDSGQCLLVLGVDGSEPACDHQLSVLQDELQPFVMRMRSDFSTETVHDYYQRATFRQPFAAGGGEMWELALPIGRVSDAARCLTDQNHAVCGRAGLGRLTLCPFQAASTAAAAAESQPQQPPVDQSAATHSADDNAGRTTAAEILQWLSPAGLQPDDCRLARISGPESGETQLTTTERELVERLNDRLDPCRLLSIV